MLPALTIPELFVKQLEVSSEKIAARYFVEDKLVSVTWAQLGADVWRLVKRIREFDLPPFSRVAQFSENRYEWIVVDLAIQFSGLVHVPLHHHLSVAQVKNQLEHSDAELLIVSPETFGLLERVSNAVTTPVHPGTVFGRSLLVIDNLRYRDEIVSVDRLLEQLRFDRVGSNDLISIIYTSGTTGDPNGVMLTQANVIANIHGKLNALPLYSSDVRLAFLPMSHIFSRTCDLYTWIASGCELVISKGRQHMFDECAIVHPTYINAVPFFYQRCYDVVHRAANAERSSDGTSNAGPGSTLRRLLGDRIRLCNCGGAPLADHVYDYFEEQGVMLVTGYGLTETSPVLTSNTEHQRKKGSVGRPLINVELRVADDGELLARGPNISQGYWKSPQKTNAAFQNGWFRTGDLASIDDDGFVTIVGRKKEMIVTNGGFNIVPGPIEEQLLKSQLVEQCIVIGNERDYLIALVVLADDHSATDNSQSRQLIASQLINEFKSLLNSHSKYEQIGDIVFADQPFTIENGLLTPKLSIRRSEIEERYRSEIERAYSSSYNSGKTS